MKIQLRIIIVLMLFNVFTFTACEVSNDGDDKIPAIKPEAADVKAVYDHVNNEINRLCSNDVNTGATAVYSYESGTLSVSVTATPVTVFPLTVVYTLADFACDVNTSSGSATSPDASCSSSPASARSAPSSCTRAASTR